MSRAETARPTLALEYSFDSRSGSGQSAQKLICNFWELGSLANSSQLIDVPIRSHGLQNFTAVVMLNLAQPSTLLLDLESALQGLKQSFGANYGDVELKKFRQAILEANERLAEHVDLNTLEILPCATLIVGGMYDVFQGFDPEIKKHVCRFLRSVAHTLGASLLFYSSKNAALAKIMRDQLSHAAFGSPQHPVRIHKTDYNDPLTIDRFADSWAQIGVLPSNSERINITFSSQIQQQGHTEAEGTTVDPSKDPNFAESIVDELRSRKDDELFRLLKNSEMKTKFDSFNLANSPFNYLN